MAFITIIVNFKKALIISAVGIDIFDVLHLFYDLQKYRTITQLIAHIVYLLIIKRLKGCANVLYASYC